MALLTYRSSNSGNLHAAYLGQVRVGYVEVDAVTGRYLWYTNLLRAGGGGYAGHAENLTIAKECLEKSIQQFLHETNLRAVGS